MKVKEAILEKLELVDFGNLEEYQCWTDDNIEVGDIVTITNNNCEFEFDNKVGRFQDNLMHCFICKLEIVNVDLSDYVQEKSSNGGGYAYADCKVSKIIKKSY